MLDHDICYAALARRDPRYDGLFFVAVRTTGNYCRPICPARTPFRRNTLFFERAAQAQEAGFRPCLRCRPESAPDSPAWAGSEASVSRALRLIDEGALAETSVERLADRLGLTGRHLRRLFVQHLGVGPLRVEQTRRVHLAKKLLHETSLSMTEIAFAAGFGSLRRFNETFQQLFGRAPSAIRRDPAGRGRPDTPLRLRLAVRPDFERPRWLRDGEGVARSVLLPTGSEVRVVLRSGTDRSLWLEIERPPVRDLARIIASVKRDLFAPPLAEVPFARATGPLRPPPRRPAEAELRAG